MSKPASILQNSYAQAVTIFVVPATMLVAYFWFRVSTTTIQPVLRSSFHLAIHAVPSILMTVAFVATLVLAIIHVVTRRERLAGGVLMMQWTGIFFLQVTMRTGMHWAYFSWGRSWGWDPIETWSAILSVLSCAIAVWLGIYRPQGYWGPVVIGLQIPPLVIMYLFSSSTAGLHHYQLWW